MKRKQSVEQVRWDLALRYRLIETVAWWEGRLTTGHLMQSFGISRQQASKDINTYITEHAPKNLTYDKQLKGYMPSKQFKPLFIDDSGSARPAVVVKLDSSEKRYKGIKCVGAGAFWIYLSSSSTPPTSANTQPTCRAVISP